MLRTTVHLAWDTEVLEGVACELVLAALWPVLGATMLDEEKGLKWWQYALGLLAWSYSPALVFVAAIVYLSTDEAASQMPEPPGWQKASDTEWYMDLPFPTELGSFVSGLSLTSVAGTHAGLVLAGSIAVVKPLAPELVAGVSAFSEWTLTHACSNPSRSRA